MSVRVRFPSEAQGRSRTESLMVSRPAFILHPTYPSRSIYLQSNRLNLIAVAAVAVVVIAVVDMVAWSWMFSNGCCD